MRGAISPELRAIFRDPQMRGQFLRRFSSLQDESASSDRGATIELGNGKRVIVTSFSRKPAVEAVKNRKRKSRNLFQVLIGR